MGRSICKQERNKGWELWFTAITKYMKANGKMIKNLEEVIKNLLMALFMKVSIKMVNQMALEN